MTDMFSKVGQAIAGKGVMLEDHDALAYEYRQQAKAAIAAHEKALEEQGLVIVPREPTDAMLNAARHGHPAPMWLAMIDKALEGKE